MRLTIVASARARHQVDHQSAMASGLRALGHEPVVTAVEQCSTKHVACWGWRHGKRLRAAGHEVLVMERGYLGDRFAWTSLAWNGLNNRGTVPEVPGDGGERFNANFSGLLKPENHAGSYALIIGQVPGDMSLQGRDLGRWYASQAKSLAVDMLVMFRPHPLASRRGPVKPVPGAVMLRGDLAPALAGASVVATYNSNTGVDALLAGKNVTVADCGSMAWGVTDRETWAHRLAWRQWTLEEIASGFALDHLGLTEPDKS